MSTKTIKISIDDLIDKFKKYNDNEEDIALIRRAYDYAEKKHFGQKRISGDDYILHPLNVALILTEISADAPCMAAALLHDTIEDSDATKEEIEELFGSEVALLVDGVTKINKLNFNTETEASAANQRKILVGLSEDPRVIIIKLADRLHNMRTISVLSVEKQKKKAKETLEILTPVAHRLGIYKIKSELEDLSLRYLKPDAYFDIVEKLNQKKTERDEAVSKMIDEVSELLNEHNIPHEIKGRSKSIYSIYNKMAKGKRFDDIYDILALRVFVDTEQDCYLALGLIHSKYKPVPKRFKDYIAMPKTNLYQSLHTTVFGIDGNLFEIQIRTYDMDEIAENGIASHWAYKENKNAAVEMQNITEQKLQFYKSIIELKDDKLTSEDFVDKVKNEVLSNNIYVYTPKGDVIELPKGATPIDFAYRVHSQVGDKMTGAIVNNNMVSLTYELKNADIIKIITNNNSKGPSREWLNIVKTTGARNKIKSFFNRTTREDYIALGKDLLEKELRRRGISIASFMDKKNLDKVFSEFKLSSVDDLYLNIGNNKFSPKSIVKHDELVEKPVKKIFKPFSKNTNNDIVVGDTKNIETHIANCCLPVPGDEIVGYITKSSGIRIHRKECSNVEFFDERKINATWNDDYSNKYNSELIIHTTSNENIIVDIVQVAASLGITCENVNLINKGSNNVYSVSVLVTNVSELDKFMVNLGKINYVNDVERIMR